MDEDDEETKQLLKQAEQIMQKEEMCRMEFRAKKRTNRPKMTRKLGERKRARSMSRLETELGALGVDVTKKRMRHLEEEQMREQTGRKIRVGRSPSLAAPEHIPRDERAIPDKKVSPIIHFL